jgi:hypothetical protein
MGAFFVSAKKNKIFLLKCISYIYMYYFYTIKQNEKIKIMKNLEVAKNWNKLSNSDKLQIIETAIDMCNTNEGFLMLRLWSKDNSLSAYITTKLDNHLCVEAVSQSTLFDLFGEDHDFQEEDAVVILKWMNEQI